MTEALPEAFWLGSRIETAVTDLDGRLRRCRVAGRARMDEVFWGEVLLADCDPPLPGQRADALVVLMRRDPAVAWSRLADAYVEAYAGAVPRDLVGAGLVRASDVASVEMVEVAAAAEALPPTAEQQWDEAFALLERFVAREGHARVPIEHVETGVHLGTWVSNQRLSRDRLSEAQLARLESLPGWQW